MWLTTILRGYRAPLSTFLLSLLVTANASAARLETDPPSAPNEVTPAPSALLAVDQNRSTVVDRIVNDWGDKLEATADINRGQLREMLFAMRADQLLAASLAGSLDGLRDVLARAPVAAKGVAVAKALGDPGTDVVYVPVTPCRLVDTRAPYPAVYQNGGPFSPGQIRDYNVQGGNGVCLSQLPPGITPAAVQLQVFGIPANGVSGDIEVLPQGAAFGSSATLVFLGNNQFTSAGTTARVNQANNLISVQVRLGIADVAMDVVGYFRAPVPQVPQKQTIAYNLAAGQISPPIPIPVMDAPVLVQAVQLEVGDRGVTQVSVLRCCSTPPTFLEWVGLSSTAGAAIVQGFSSTAGTLITHIDFGHQVVLEVHDADNIRVRNSSAGVRSGIVTLTW